MANQKSKKELRALAEELTEKFNEAIHNGKYDESAKLDEEIAQTVNEYTSVARDECFGRILATEDPMMAAVRELTFQTIRVVDRKVGDEKIPVREVVDADKYIDLLKLHKAGGGIGKDKNWPFAVEKLNFLLTAQKCIELGTRESEHKTVSQVLVEMSDSYAMSDIAKAIDMGKTPTSKTGILKALQAVVTAMIGEEYKATSRDVAYLLSVYSRSSRKALTVTCANHKYLRQYLANVCNRIVKGEYYVVDYKKTNK